MCTRTPPTKYYNIGASSPTSTTRMSRGDDPPPSSFPKTRREGSRPISPSCRNCCVRLDSPIGPFFRMSLRERTRPGLGLIEPCLPSPAKAPPSGPGWIHEIKHDGFRIMARRDGAGVRLITRHGNDFTARFPLVASAVSALPARSCLIDGEAIVCDENGLAVFDLIRGHGG